ncbi:unnamed protein product, partial [Mesorhabditis spiculigera]
MFPNFLSLTSLTSHPARRDESQVSWSVPPAFNSLLSITKNGLLRTFSTSGPAGLLKAESSSGANKTLLVPVQITPARSIWVEVFPPLSAPESSPLTALNVGQTLDLYVHFRDRFGVRLVAAPNRVNFRPHRFDLTEIAASNGNRTLAITLKTPGETVLRIWDAEDQSIETFIRFSAADLPPPDANETTKDESILKAIAEPSCPIQGASTADKASSFERLGFFDWLRYMSKHLVTLLCGCGLLIITTCCWILLRRSPSKKGAANHNTTGVFASDRSNANVTYGSSPGSSPSVSYTWQENPPRFHSTPIETSSMGPIGSGGSPQLWTTSPVRRRV